jgi:hypothetical protein
MTAPLAQNMPNQNNILNVFFSLMFTNGIAVGENSS